MSEHKPFEWDFSGACAPGSRSQHAHQTFSVGIFQWLPTKRSKRLKKGKVVKRIKGFMSEPDSVYAQAEAECAYRNMQLSQTGTWSDPHE